MQSKILLVANKLKIFETIKDKKMTVEDISDVLSLNLRQCKIFLNALVSIGILIKEDNLYSNSSDVKEFLVSDSQNYFGHLLLFQENEWDSWDYLYDTMVSGEPKGVNLSERMPPEELKVYIQAMHETGKFPASIIPSLVNLKGYKSLLDLGCGSGVYSMGFLKRNPGMKITLLDYPEVIELTKDYVSNQTSYSDVSFVCANYHEYEFTERYDCVFCSHNIHENSDESNLNLFKKIYSAIEQGGRIIIHDYIVDETDVNPIFPAVFSVNMLLQTSGGKCYSVNEIKEWLLECGFTNVQFIQLGIDFPSSIITAQKEN